ncbi:MAG: NAD(+)/NADH kinase [bacterium]|nr:NAD(+)/NADH kinase [bacterium]
MKRAFINANLEKPKSKNVLLRFEKWAKKNCVDIYPLSKKDGYLKIIRSIKEEMSSSEMKKAGKESFAVSFGGDGTMLATARTVSSLSIPLLGINLGSLGFLSSVKESQMEEKLDLVKNKKFAIENCSMLGADIKGVEVNAFNDVIMISKEPQRLIKIKIDVDDKNVLTISADGVIVSTPKGSTAYSMAAGGPIVFSDVDCFVITPICPHLLVQRSIVVPQTSIVKLTPISSDAVISGDSQTKHPIEKRSSAIIYRSRKRVSLIKFPDIDFISIMKEKFYFGRDPRE